jgi:hypothetical protein
MPSKARVEREISLRQHNSRIVLSKAFIDNSTKLKRIVLETALPQPNKIQGKQVE